MINIVLLLVLFITAIFMIYEFFKLKHNYFVECKYDICYNDLYNSDFCKKNNNEFICQNEYILKGEYGSKLGINYYIAQIIFIITIFILLIRLIINKGDNIERKFF